MSKNNNSLLIIGIAAIGYYLYTTKKAITQLVYNVTNASISFNGLTPVLNLTIQISNASGSTFVIENILGNVSVNGANIGTVTDFTPVTINASSQANMNLSVNLSLTSAVSDLVNLITNETGNAMTILFTGFVTANNVQAPLSLKYTISF